MTPALAPAVPAARSQDAGLPLLSRVVDAGRAVRLRVRRVQAFHAMVAARRRLRAAADPGGARPEILAELARRMLALDGAIVDVIGIPPRGPCVVLAAVAAPRELLAVMSAVPGLAVVEHGPLAGPTGARLGVCAVDPVAGPRRAVAHAVDGLRARLPVIVSAGAVGVDELIGLAALIGAPVVPVRVLARSRRRELIIRAPQHALPGEPSGAFSQRLRVELGTPPASQPDRGRSPTEWM